MSLLDVRLEAWLEYKATLSTDEDTGVDRAAMADVIGLVAARARHRGGAHTQHDIDDVHPSVGRAETRIRGEVSSRAFQSYGSSVHSNTSISDSHRAAYVRVAALCSHSSDQHLLVQGYR